MGEFFGGLLGGIGNVVSSWIGSRTARKNTRKTIKANKEMAEYAYSKDLEMWERQNKYNSPSAQMQRLKEAGLNPHLVYGTGAVAGNTSGQLPQYQAPRQEYNYRGIDFSGIMSAYQDTKQRSAQVDLTKAQIGVQKAMHNLTLVKQTGIFQDNTIKAVEATIAAQMMKDNLTDIKDVAHMRIGSMKAQEWYNQAVSDIKQWEKGLTDQNINPQDSTALRFAIDLLQILGFDPAALKKKYGIK